MASIWDIDDWVEEIASMDVKKFYPTAVAKDTGLPLQVVFEHLLSLTNSGKIILLWEIRCPNYECVRNIITTDNPSLYIGKIIDCRICGEEIEVTQNIIFPVFKVAPDYKDRVRQKKTNRIAVAFAMSKALAKIPYR